MYPGCCLCAIIIMCAVDADFWYQQLRLLKKQSELLRPLALKTSAPSPQDTEDKTGTNPLWEMIIEEETTTQEEEQQDEEEQMLKQKLNVQRLLLQQHHQRTQQRQQKLENQRQEAAAAEAAVAATAARGHSVSFSLYIHLSYILYPSSLSISIYI
jgi:hypothetical protein